MEQSTGPSAGRDFVCFALTKDHSLEDMASAKKQLEDLIAAKEREKAVKACPATAAGAKLPAKAKSVAQSPRTKTSAVKAADPDKRLATPSAAASAIACVPAKPSASPEDVAMKSPTVSTAVFSTSAVTKHVSFSTLGLKSSSKPVFPSVPPSPVKEKIDSFLRQARLGPAARKVDDASGTPVPIGPGCSTDEFRLTVPVKKAQPAMPEYREPRRYVKSSLPAFVNLKNRHVFTGEIPPHHLIKPMKDFATIADPDNFAVGCALLCNTILRDPTANFGAVLAGFAEIFLDVTVASKHHLEDGNLELAKAAEDYRNFGTATVFLVDDDGPELIRRINGEVQPPEVLQRMNMTARTNVLITGIRSRFALCLASMGQPSVEQWVRLLANIVAAALPSYFIFSKSTTGQCKYRGRFVEEYCLNTVKESCDTLRITRVDWVPNARWSDEPRRYFVDIRFSKYDRPFELQPWHIQQGVTKVQVTRDSIRSFVKFFIQPYDMTKLTEQQAEAKKE